MKRSLVFSILALCATVIIALVAVNTMTWEKAPAPKATSSANGALAVLSPKDIEPDRLDMARSVAALIDVNSRLESAFLGMSMMDIPALMKENPKQSQMILKIARETVSRLAATHVQEAREDKAVVLASLFSADDLRALKSFYQSSLGQKLMKASEEMARREVMFAQKLAVEQAKATRAEILKDEKAGGIKIPPAVGEKK